MKISVFTDGGSRGNPGLAACAYFIYDEQGNVVQQEGKFLGQKTNNEAEYAAFLTSAEWIKKNLQAYQIEHIDWHLDSMLVVEQLNRHWKIKEARMHALAEQIFQNLKTLPSHTIKYVPRAQNAAADSLVNQTLDLQT